MAPCTIADEGERVGSDLKPVAYNSLIGDRYERLEPRDFRRAVRFFLRGKFDHHALVDEGPADMDADIRAGTRSGKRASASVATPENGARSLRSSEKSRTTARVRAPGDMPSSSLPARMGRTPPGPIAVIERKIRDSHSHCPFRCMIDIVYDILRSADRIRSFTLVKRGTAAEESPNLKAVIPALI